MKVFFAAASPEHQKKQKAKAQELRASQWWKNQLGRGVCYHCEQRFHPSELTMDHLIPIARGGLSDRKNCVPSCKACNTKKGHRTRVEIALEEMPVEGKPLIEEDKPQQEEDKPQQEEDKPQQEEDKPQQEEDKPQREEGQSRLNGDDSQSDEKE